MRGHVGSVLLPGGPLMTGQPARRLSESNCGHLVTYDTAVESGHQRHIWAAKWQRAGCLCPQIQLASLIPAFPLSESKSPIH
jgi:hypothetical protein